MTEPDKELTVDKEQADIVAVSTFLKNLGFGIMVAVSDNPFGTAYTYFKDAHKALESLRDLPESIQ